MFDNSKALDRKKQDITFEMKARKNFIIEFTNTAYEIAQNYSPYFKTKENLEIVEHRGP